MPKHTENALTDRKILNAKSKDKQYKIFDGKGLFVLIHPNGSKYCSYSHLCLDASSDGARSQTTLQVTPTNSSQSDTLQVKSLFLVNQTD